MKKITTIAYLALLLPVFTEAGPVSGNEPGDPPVSLKVEHYQRAADSLFKLTTAQDSSWSWEHASEFFRSRTAKWESVLSNAQGLKEKERNLLGFYGRAKLLRAKSDYLYYNLWAKDHRDALSNWALEGMRLQEAEMGNTSLNTWYNYIRDYLEAKVGGRTIKQEYSFSRFAGNVEQYKYLLQSDCPDSAKFGYLDMLLPNELQFYLLTPEVRVLEPYIRKGFKDPGIIHYYDSVFSAYHRLDPGQPAIDITMHDLNGRTMKLSDFRGKKIVIDLWATWCKSCIERMPYFDSLATANKDTNTVYITYSVDVADSADWSLMWKDFALKHKMDPSRTFMGPTLGSVNGLDAIRNNYLINAFPHYFIIDRNFRIVTLDSILPWNPEFLWNLKD